MKKEDEEMKADNEKIRKGMKKLFSSWRRDVLQLQPSRLHKYHPTTPTALTDKPRNHNLEPKSSWKEEAGDGGSLRGCPRIGGAGVIKRRFDKDGNKARKARVAGRKSGR